MQLYIKMHLLISVQAPRQAGDELEPTPRRRGVLWCPTPRGNTKVLVWSQQCIARVLALFVNEGHSYWTYHCWPSFNSVTRILFYFIKAALLEGNDLWIVRYCLHDGSCDTQNRSCDILDRSCDTLKTLHRSSDTEDRSCDSENRTVHIYIKFEIFFTWRLKTNWICM